MFAGSGYAGDFAGDQLSWVDNERVAWLDGALTQMRALWTALAGLPIGTTWTFYANGDVITRNAGTAGTATASPAGTLPPMAAIAIAPGVDQSGYDPLGGAESVNLETLAGRYENQIRDLYRISDDSLGRYELYRGLSEADPDLDGTPFETFSTLPHETAELAYPAVHKFVLRRRNKYNLCSQNMKSWRLELDAEGAEVLMRPTAPGGEYLEAGVGGTFRVTAEYNYKADGDLPADAWLVYLKTGGSDPDPDVDTPVVVPMSVRGALSLLDYTSASVGNGVVGKVLVRTRRTDDVADSTNENVIGPVTSSTAGPAAPVEGGAFFGALAKQV